MFVAQNVSLYWHPSFFKIKACLNFAITMNFEPTSCSLTVIFWRVSVMTLAVDWMQEL